MSYASCAILIPRACECIDKPFETRQEALLKVRQAIDIKQNLILRSASWRVSKDRPRVAEFGCQQNPGSGWKWGASVARRPPNRAYLDDAKQREPYDCHWHLYDWPDNSGTIPGEKQAFTRASILFRPQRPKRASRREIWWRRRVPPPGPHRLLHKPFIAIVGCPTVVI